jgi:hypothetical protein
MEGLAMNCVVVGTMFSSKHLRSAGYPGFIVLTLPRTANLTRSKKEGKHQKGRLADGDELNN